MSLPKRPVTQKKRSSLLYNSRAPKKIMLFKITKAITLLIITTLIKIGQLPQNIYLYLVRDLPWTKPSKPKKRVRKSRKATVFSLKRLKHNSFVVYLLHFLNLKHKQGRPRQQSWIAYQRSKIKRLLALMVPRGYRLKVALVSLAVIFFFWSFVIAKLASEIPSPTRLTTTERPMSTQIYDRNGKLLYQFFEGRNRTLVKLEELPPYLVDATVAIEDKHFYNHPGIDLTGIVRALQTNLQNDDSLEGGSTITQQLIKNVLLTPDKTWTRKIKEAILAFWVERIYNKQDILQMYFNEVPYGGPAWGIQAAAETYFGKEAKYLSLAESTFLAGLPAAPTYYSPYGIYPEKGKERQKEVLRRMVEDGYITQAQADNAYHEELDFRSTVGSIKAPHFSMYVRSILASKYGNKLAAQGGLKVITTLDLDIQEMTEEVVAKQIQSLAKMKVGNGAAMVTDTKTGQILAMVGSKDYYDPNGGNFNVALALRQPGSSVKPITYAAAFKQGFNPGSIVMDTPTSFPGISGPYSPVNYDGRFHGPVTIRTALGSSYNIPAVKILALIGVDSMLDTAREMGIESFDPNGRYGLSITLGGAAVKMIDMMSVYGTFASGGVRHTPQAILKVTDSKGNILEEYREENGKRVLTEEVAYLINHVLSDNNARVPAFGRKSLLEIPNHTVAVKTGTSDEKRDNWAFGYTPEFVVGTWVGNNNYSPMDPQLASGITGATPIWHDIMANLLADRPGMAFKRPTGITETTINGRKDLAISGQTPKTVADYKRIPDRQNISGKDDITYSTPLNQIVPEWTKTTQ